MTEDREPSFTDWEIKALEMLPADGSWRGGLGQKPAGGAESLHRYHRMAEYETINGQVWRARLTERGKRAKAALPTLKEEEKQLRIRILGGVV